MFFYFNIRDKLDKVAIFGKKNNESEIQALKYARLIESLEYIKEGRR